jgi:Arc/MetJ-type ribon-helix-helix transcriptional regulator
MADTIHMTLPPRVQEQIRALIAAGWFRDENDVVSEALRRFLDTHRPDVLEQYIREDVEWGLHGRD